MPPNAPRYSRSFLAGLLLALAAVAFSSRIFAEERSPVAVVERLENGLSMIISKHLVLVTDLPISAEITDLSTMFDSAMQQWGDAFGIPMESWIDSRAHVCLIVDRQRFIDLQYISPEVPSFREGYQFQDRLFMLEQPSAYYRRHLLLHEGTHWFLWKFVGGNGPPWFSEGTCELMSTHRWSENGLDHQLKLDWIPPDRESVPYWGRLKRIRDAIASKTAPSLDRILQYSDTAHRTDEPYAWSWAAIIFFTRNVRYQNNLKEVFLPNLKSHIGSEYKLNQDFKDRLRDRWNEVQAEWTTFINELDYGYSPEHSMPEIKLSEQLPLSDKKTFSIQSNRGWQSTGVRVSKGDRISSLASGRVIVRKEKPLANDVSSNSQDWESEPQGVTLQYNKGFPIGKLLAVILPSEDQIAESNTTIPLLPIGIGKKLEWTADMSGILLMKLNEPSSELFDNAGEYSITLSLATDNE